MSTLRRRVIYEGRVQGVGFRMTARRLSSAYPILGYVRNLDDGRVELVAEGEAQILASFLQAIQREFGDMIRGVQEVQESSVHENLVGFTIRY
jgi:acylphosphatase